MNTLQKPIMDRLGEAYDSPEKVSNHFTNIDNIDGGSE